MGRISTNSSFIGSDSGINCRSESQTMVGESSFEDVQVIAIDESVKIVFKTNAEEKKENSSNLRHQLQAARSEIELLKLKLDLKDQEVIQISQRLDHVILKACSKE